jgi:hypothetical protein
MIPPIYTVFGMIRYMPYWRIVHELYGLVLPKDSILWTGRRVVLFISKTTHLPVAYSTRQLSEVSMRIMPVQFGLGQETLSTFVIILHQVCTDLNLLILASHPHQCLFHFALRALSAF